MPKKRKNENLTFKLVVDVQVITNQDLTQEDVAALVQRLIENGQEQAAESLSNGSAEDNGDDADAELATFLECKVWGYGKKDTQLERMKQMEEPGPEQDKHDIVRMIEEALEAHPDASELLPRFDWLLRVWNTDRHFCYPSLEVYDPTND